MRPREDEWEPVTHEAESLVHQHLLRLRPEIERSTEWLVVYITNRVDLLLSWQGIKRGNVNVEGRQSLARLGAGSR